MFAQRSGGFKGELLDQCGAFLSRVGLTKLLLRLGLGYVKALDGRTNTRFDCAVLLSRSACGQLSCSSYPHQSC